MAERRTAKAKAGAKKAGSAGGRATTKRAASASATKRTAAATKGGAARGRQQRAQKAASKTARAATKPAAKAGLEAKSVAELRDALRKNLIRPSGIVMLSRDRIEEALNDAVKNGHITAKGARSIASDLLARGRKQTNDVLGDLEQLLGKGRDELEDAAKGARKRARGATKDARSRATGATEDARKRAAGARKRATRAASPALAQADRARRAAGVGANFPITGYDDLTAPQVTSRLSDLTPAQLRKVRDHERRNAARKTILNAIETKLK